VVDTLELNLQIVAGCLYKAQALGKGPILKMSVCDGRVSDDVAELRLLSIGCWNSFNRLSNLALKLREKSRHN
jgi:hypothetical protein